jgi:hypothetical protein
MEAYMAEQKQAQTSLPTLSKENGLQRKFWTPDDRINVAAALGKVFDIQKQFGKTPTQLKTIIEGFCWALQRYPAERVIWALGEYMLLKPDMPTPHDIRQLIDPIPEAPKWDKAYYVRLMKLREEHGPYALNDEEEAYANGYEEHVRMERPH